MNFYLLTSRKKISSIAVFKNHTLASGPITSWQIDGETVETLADFILGAPKSLQLVFAAM